jgi:two-component system response regulator YesN
MNLLIVDDEKKIREGMKEYITKKKFRFNHISTAKDATEALQISSCIKPDLLITDIAMPKIDGIELASRIKVLYPDVKIVMITGFQEIDFMKRAFKLSVIDFLLKPIDLNELNPILEKIVSTYETETIEKAEMVSLKGNWRDNISVLRGVFLSSLLSGVVQNSASMTNQMKSLQIDLNVMRSMVVVSILFDSNDILNSENPLNQVMNIVDGTLRKAGTCSIFQVSGTEIVGIVNPEFTNNVQDSIHAVCCTLLDVLINCYGEGITIGIGSLADNYLALAESYSASDEAVNQRFILGSGQVIESPALHTRIPLIFIPEQALVDDLILYIKAGEPNKVKEVIQLILKPLYRGAFMSSNEIEMVRLELVSMAKQILGKLSHVAAKQYNLGDLLKLKTLSEIERNIVVLLSLLCEYYQQHSKKKPALIISKVMEMTETRYNEPLNVQYIADCMHISPNYFSTLFKRETGINYMEYLINRRLEKSLYMILNTTHKISEIACQVGYPDANYFAKVFKNHFGKSPSEYREGYH